MASMTLPPNNPVTQIIYLTIPPDQDLTHGPTASKTWAEAIDILEQHPGFQRCYWGRSLETPKKVQLHVVRATLSQHKSFLTSPLHPQLLQTLYPLTSTLHPPLIRHAHLHPFHTPSPLHPPFPPFIGTAIYLSTTPTWHEGAWPLWTHIVRYVKGCTGIVGGSLEEDVDGHGGCYLVYVGWSSVEEHENYHHTKHFENRRVVLGLGNKGFREYGHLVVQGSREGARGREREAKI